MLKPIHSLLHHAESKIGYLHCIGNYINSHVREVKFMLCS